MRYKIHFTKEKRTYEAEEGMTLLQAAIAAEIFPDAPCGGLGKCGKCKMWVDEIEILACQTEVHQEMWVDTGIDEKKNAQILQTGLGRGVACAPGELPHEVLRPLLAAVDLGSTSVVAYLIDGKTGEMLSIKSMLNPQRQYGADVVMRGNYAMEHGAQTLSGCIRDGIDELLHKSAEDIGRNAEDIVRITMVGNSCMHHLFLEIPVDTLVVAPYEPKVKDGVVRSALECGLHVYPEAKLFWLPNVGGFVGADTAACILAAEYDKREELTLMIDIGTNGEMVLGDKNGFSACSTAAGPAFEGAKITCGMRGSAGAIDHVSLRDGEIWYHMIGDDEWKKADGEPEYIAAEESQKKTELTEKVNEQSEAEHSIEYEKLDKPTGICGSGLLDAVHCLLLTDQIDDTGRMEETFYFSSDVFLNQRDIRELQLAKAAIAAGVQMLCKRRRVKVTEIKKVLLAGAFGNYMNPESACGIGLIPKELLDCIIPVGNLAGKGAQIAALNEDEYQKSKDLAKEADFVELALDPDFQDVYVDEMFFL